LLQLKNIGKSYKLSNFTQTALNNLSLTFRENEFVAILGPSGSGKTTLLNIIGGLDRADSGELIIDNTSTRQYRDRDWDTYRNNRIGFVFQSYNLIQHQTILMNVELALTLSGVHRRERHDRALAALAKVGLAEHALKRPSQLSGGQMQRVAIARALVNNPDILLADEPTGALDSKTSVAIMDLLAEIASDRLVIMVTHNPQLAQDYANRIIELRDGLLISDTNPFTPEAAAVQPVTAPHKQGKTRMTFWTAVKLSFRNLMTKKARTFMVSFAGSIGIIGIALILGISNGAHHYISNVEEETLSAYPLSIQSGSVDIASLLSAFMNAAPSSASAEQTDQGDVIREDQVLQTIFTRLGTNNLHSLKAFLDSDASEITQYTNLIKYDYNVSPQIYGFDSNSDSYRISPNDSSFSSFGNLSSTASPITAIVSGVEIFHELPSDSELFTSQYDIMAGRWPAAYNECMAVLDSNGSLSDLTFYELGLRDHDDLVYMLRALAQGKTVSVSESNRVFTYSDLFNLKLKLVYPTDYYRRSESNSLWVDMRDNADYMTPIVNAAPELKVVGVVKPRKDAVMSLLSPGIYYTQELTFDVMAHDADAPITKAQIAEPDVDVFTGKAFAEEADQPKTSAIVFSSIINVDGDKLKEAFTIDPKALNIDLTQFFDVTRLAEDVPSFPSPDLSGILDSVQSVLPSLADLNTDGRASGFITGMINDYFSYCAHNGIRGSKEIMDNVEPYLEQPAVEVRLRTELTSLLDTDAIQAQVEKAFADYMRQTMSTLVSQMATAVQEQLQAATNSAIGQLAKNFSQALNVDQDTLSQAFSLKVDRDELSQYLMSALGNTAATYDGNLETLGYADRDDPDSISIYPKSFDSKTQVLDILNGYNQRMKDEGEDDKVITFTDVVGALMSSVSQIVNVVTYMLIAFVGVSLVVSSIMIGVITYISVLERKKEIGILRSIGASKSDVGHIFNAETFIIGLIAGVIAIAVTLLISVPVNLIVERKFEVADILVLSAAQAIILVSLSIVLTLIAGLIPSSSAARKDPVEALRDE
jgi:ABC-type lipoprotein export system ATPase subunit/ABC-type antimicrobial peptide transport system permease subunit